MFLSIPMPHYSQQNLKKEIRREKKLASTITSLHRLAKRQYLLQKFLNAFSRNWDFWIFYLCGKLST